MRPMDPWEISALADIFPVLASPSLVKVPSWELPLRPSLEQRLHIHLLWAAALELLVMGVVLTPNSLAWWLVGGVLPGPARHLVLAPDLAPHRDWLEPALWLVTAGAAALIGVHLVRACLAWGE